MNSAKLDTVRATVLFLALIAFIAGLLLENGSILSGKMLQLKKTLFLINFKKYLYRTH